MKYLYNKHILKKNISIVVLILSSNSVFSAELEHELILPVTVQYESNAALSSVEEQSIYTRIFSPRYIATIQDEQDTLKADFSYRIERSSDNSISENREDPSVDLGWFHLLENGIFSINFRLNEESTRETEFDDSGLIALDGSRKSKIFSINWEHNLNEKLLFAINGSRNESTYENIGLVDYTSETVNTRINYLFDETVTTYLEIGKTKYVTVDDQINRDSQYANIGSSFELTENTSLAIYLGVSDTETTSDQETDKQGGITINYEEERMTSSLELSRTISPSGTGEFIKSDQVTGNWSYEITETSSLGFELHYRKNFDAIENKTKMFSANYNKQLGERLGVSFSGSRRQLESNNFEASNDIIAISLNYTI